MRLRPLRNLHQVLTTPRNEVSHPETPQKLRSSGHARSLRCRLSEFERTLSPRRNRSQPGMRVHHPCRCRPGVGCGNPQRKTMQRRSDKVETVGIHDLAPGRHEIPRELLLRIVLPVDFCNRAELRVGTEYEVDAGGGPLQFARCAVASIDYYYFSDSQSLYTSQAVGALPCSDTSTGVPARGLMMISLTRGGAKMRSK